MKFEVAALTELASIKKVTPTEITRVCEEALTDAYSKGADPVPGAKAKIDVYKGQLYILDEEGNDVTPEDFGRLVASIMRQAVTMWSRDLDRRRKLGTWADKVGTLVTGQVRAHAGRNQRGETVISLGDNVEAIMPRGEATPGEVLKHGEDVTAYIVAVNPDDRGRVKVTVSRRQPALVTELIKSHSPEVADGRVIITNVAREPGHRSKIAVKAGEGYTGDLQEAIFGAGAYRIRGVAAKLKGEKVDVVVDTGVIEEFVANSLTPAKVAQVQMTDAPHGHAIVAVDRDQMKLAIGSEGRNVRLASKLTNVKIDVLIAE